MRELRSQRNKSSYNKENYDILAQQKIELETQVKELNQQVKELQNNSQVNESVDFNKSLIDKENTIAIKDKKINELKEEIKSLKDNDKSDELEAKDAKIAELKEEIKTLKNNSKSDELEAKDAKIAELEEKLKTMSNDDYDSIVSTISSPIYREAIKQIIKAYKEHKNEWFLISQSKVKDLVLNNTDITSFESNQFSAVKNWIERLNIGEIKKIKTENDNLPANYLKLFIK